MAISKCYCQSDGTYLNCCEPLHNGEPATNAEQLMRSRYSAYVLSLESYLLNTWHPDTRPASLGLSQDSNRKWLGLSIKRAESTGDNTAIVEFIARFKDGGGRAERLHEVSRFVLLDHWYYLDGDLVT